MTRLHARPGSRGALICGQPSCGRELPGVYRMGPSSSHGVPDDMAWLFLAIGWVPGDDGLWELSRRARRNRAFLDGRVPDARRRADLQDTVGLTPGPDGMVGHVAPDVPCGIVCPRCGTPQQLDPNVLGVEPRRSGRGDSIVVVPRSGRAD